MFSNCKLERATKRAAGIQNDPVGHSKMRRTSIEVQQCFLCEKMEPTSELRQAMTMQLNQRLNECAPNLNDGKLLALLSGGDVVALELIALKLRLGFDHVPAQYLSSFGENNGFIIGLCF